MSRTNPPIIAIENNDEAYIIWKKKKIHNATVLHIDAHLDYRSKNTKMHIGNYLKHAIEDGIADCVFWVVPGSRERFLQEMKEIKTKLRSAGISEDIVKTKKGILTKIGKTTLIVCSADLLPETISGPMLVDIDLDFLFFPSCVAADRIADIGKRKPWMTPEDFVKIMQRHIKNSVLTTLCYSTTGGWTPMKYRHYGDGIMELMGLHNDKIRQNIIAGTFFESFSKHFKKNELKQAIPYFRSALSLNPKYASFYTTDGPLFLLKGDLKSAEKEFSRLQQIDPENIYSHFGLGLVHLLSGDLKQAKYFFQAARDITSSNEIVLFLIYIQSQLGEHKMVKELLQEYQKNEFPKKPLSEKTLHGLMKEISDKLKKESQEKNIGQMYLYPNSKAVYVWEELAKYSPNNIGNWTEEPAKLRHTAAAMELDLVEKMADLYFDNSSKYGGYMTSGATEGNIFSAWVGRKYLEERPVKSQIVLLANDLTHYSIFKATDIVGVPVQKIPVNLNDWNADIGRLFEIIIQLHKKGVSKFLIPLTLGHTVGGTNDNIQKIVQGLQKLKKRIGVEYFLWIDAALSGLSMPFLDKCYRDFFPKEISTVVVDFHKVLGVPMPAGLILYQKSLSKYIRTSVPYLSVSDSTLLGSRNGVAPIAAWMSIHQLGFQKLSEILRKEIKRKGKTLEEIQKDVPHVKIYTDKHSLQAAIVASKKLPSRICQRYGLQLRQYRINNTIYLIYPMFFLPDWH